VIYLVGSGPGDPGLFTVKGVRCMQEADAVVYDRLAPEALLAHARPDAELIYVGKKPGNPSMPQEEINALLVRLGRAERRLFALKGAIRTSLVAAARRRWSWRVRGSPSRSSPASRAA
jgi:uroporphyrinogen III methyltransferase/synthase